MKEILGRTLTLRTLGSPGGGGGLRFTVHADSQAGSDFYTGRRAAPFRTLARAVAALDPAYRYVTAHASNDGSDANPGTRALPVATLAQAVALA